MALLGQFNAALLYFKLKLYVNKLSSKVVVTDGFVRMPNAHHTNKNLNQLVKNLMGD